MFSRMLWIVLAIVVFVFGALGLLALSVGVLIDWSVLSLVIGLVAWRCVAQLPKARLVFGATRPDWATGSVAAAGVLVVGVVTTGMVATIGAGEATGVLLFTTAVWAGWLYWSGRVSLADSPSGARGCPSPAPPVLAPAPGAAAVDLTTGALCLAWRRSYVELRQCTDEPTWQRVVRSREEYLDELERRDREGFARWLGSGARAGSDPQRYLTAGG